MRILGNQKYFYLYHSIYFSKKITFTYTCNLYEYKINFMEYIIAAKINYYTLKLR